MESTTEHISFEEAKSRCTQGLTDAVSSNMSIDGNRVVIRVMQHPRMFPAVHRADPGSHAELKAIRYLKPIYAKYRKWLYARMENNLPTDLCAIGKDWYENINPLPSQYSVYHLHVIVEDANTSKVYGWLCAEYNKLKGYTIRILYASCEDKDMESVVYDTGEPLINNMLRLVKCIGTRKPVHIDLMSGVHNGIERSVIRNGYSHYKGVVYYPQQRWYSFKGIVKRPNWIAISKADADKYYTHLYNSYAPSLRNQILRLKHLHKPVFKQLLDASMAWQPSNVRASYIDFQSYVYSWTPLMTNAETRAYDVHHIIKSSDPGSLSRYGGILIEAATTSPSNSVDCRGNNKRVFIASYRTDQGAAVCPRTGSGSKILMNKLPNIPKEMPKWGPKGQMPWFVNIKKRKRINDANRAIPTSSTEEFL